MKAVYPFAIFKMMIVLKW